MKILLDTHIIIWAALNDSQLSQKAKDIIVNPENEIYYSTASVWEITIKHMAHPSKMRYSGDYLAEQCDKHGYYVLPIENKHVSALVTLQRSEDAPAHNDPFDRIMLAQAKVEEEQDHFAEKALQQNGLFVRKTSGLCRSAIIHSVWLEFPPRKKYNRIIQNYIGKRKSQQ